MAYRRIGLILFGLWALDLVAAAVLPFFHLLADPLMLFFILLGLRWPRTRFLWLYGMGVGLLRDLSVGGLFGGWSCAFGLTGWGLTYLRQLLEVEGPRMLALCTALATLWAGLAYALILASADPAVAWRFGSWGFLLLQAGLHGAGAFWLFPRLERFLTTPSGRNALSAG